MSATAHTFSPKDTLIVVNSVRLGGYAKGDFFSHTINEDAFKEEVGSDGEVVRIANANESSTLLVRLHQGSASNDVLSGFHRTDKLSKTLVFPVQFTDLFGLTKGRIAEAWIKKYADIKWADGAQVREWTIFCVKPLLINVGGNP